MATNISLWFAGGMERAQAGVIDSASYFGGSVLTVANGANSPMLQLTGAKAADVPGSGQRIIQPEGDDGVVGRIALPGIEAIQFELQLSVMNLAFAALAQGTKVRTLEEQDMLDIDPENPTYQTLMMLFSRKAGSKVAASPGAGWENLLLFKTFAFLNGPGGYQTGENAAEYGFNVVVDRSSLTPWGEALTTTGDGTLFSAGKMYWTENRQTFHLLKGDATVTTVTLPYRPVSGTLNDRFLVFINGVKQTTGITINTSTKVVTFSAAPAAGAKVVIVYEHDYS